MKPSASCMYKAATLLLATGLFYFQIYHVFASPLWRDDAVYAIAAKNLASGMGYQGVFFDEMSLFHHSISAGPVIILPAAFFIFLFGNQYWVPALTNIVLIWGFLIAAFIAAGHLIGNEKKWQFCFIALSLALLFSTGEPTFTRNFGIETGDRLALWHLLLGEIPAALCVITATLVTFTPPATLKRMFFAGILLSAALLAKTVTGIAVLTTLSAAAAVMIFSPAPRLTRVRLIGMLLLGTILPLALFEVVKIVAMGIEPYLQLQAIVANDYKYNALIADSLTSDGVEKKSQAFAYFISVLGIFGAYAVLLFLPAMGYMVYACFNKKSRRLADDATLSARIAGLTLLLAFVFHAAWWILLSSGNARHLVVALIYYAAGTALLLSALRLTKVSGVLIALFILCFYVSYPDKLRYLFYDAFIPNDHLKTQLEVKTILKNLEAKNVTFFSCSANFELEYLLPGSRHFRWCSDLLSAPPVRPSVLVNYFVRPGEILLYAPNSYYVKASSVPPDILAKCAKPLFESGAFSLRWCNENP